ncbi:HAD family hydrolase [Microbacterium sp. KUDC0406]|uniref:HAD family hydrolase n=1 Tax=Microbacterium sp. KUDC0406 TaxID=2909588 RepID=UPI001F2060E4|nr:HAD family hydrolase [Microbacterium sp. KUDC0406]UJP10140.1 HAD family hydrolase [Microbacterium sp. KUDC0406]
MPLAIFDLDGTLVDQERAAREWTLQFARAWSLDPDACDVISSALAQPRPKGEVFGELVRRFALPVAAADVWDDYRARMPGLVRCTDDDRAALVELRAAGWTIGIATNGMADNQEGKIRSTGLSELVDGWVVSSEIGVRKPEPEIFRELARRLSAPLDGWMIGDSLVMDVAGGQGVGLQTAWIMADPTPRSDPAPTFTAATVAGAVRLILG